ncbi:MAG: cytochrome c oxidase subunit II [Actinomycetota bacterium]
MWARRPVVLSSLICAIVALAGCAPRPVNAQGKDVKGLYDIFTVTAAVIFVLVTGLIAWSILRYRAKPGDNDLPDQFHSNVKLEILWFAIPSLIVIGLFVSSTVVLDRINDEDDGATIINAEAFQWGWRFVYEGEDVSIISEPDEPATISVPVGEPVTFVITSHDVVHSFYITEFLVKRDAVPGRENRLPITIDEEGTYGGRCAEFCGLLHDDMPFTIEAVPAAEHADWLEERAGDQDALNERRAG